MSMVFIKQVRFHESATIYHHHNAKNKRITYMKQTGHIKKEYAGGVLSHITTF